MRIQHFQGPLRLRMASIAIAGFLGMAAAQSWGANIAWLSLHNPDGSPSTPAATAGFTTAPDIAYTNLLTSSGHTVTRITTLAAPALPDFTMLNTFDLVIIGRSINSVDFETDAETDAWNNKITKPMIIMSGYILRNNRLGFTSGTTIPDTGGTGNPTAVVKLKAEVPGHAIFNGIALDGTNTMTANYTTGLPTAPYNPAIVHRGISVNTNNLQGGGQNLATINTAGDAADDAALAGNGGMTIGFWPAGSVLTNTTAPDLNDTLGGDRLVFLSGTREEASPADKAGLFDLTPEGTQLFLNAVSFMSGPLPGLGDVDLDEDVDMDDFNVIKNNFQKTVSGRAFGDLTGDLKVNWLDFRQWKTAFNAQASAAAGSIPEPAGVLLGLMAASALLGVGRSLRRRSA